MTPVPWKSRSPEGESVPPLAGLRNEMDRLLDTFVREPLGLGSEWPFGRGCTLPVDLGETPEEILVRAEIPGIDLNDLEVTISAGQLVLAGEKKDVAATSGRDYYHTESRFGRFRRTIPLSQAVDPEQIQAEYVNGVLTVRLKKIPAAAPKRVEVKVRPAAEAPPSPSTPEPPPVS